MSTLHTVEAVTAFKTPDGSLFERESSAFKHLLFCDVVEYFQDHSSLELSECHAIASTVLSENHRKELQRLLDKARHYE